MLRTVARQTGARLARQPHWPNAPVTLSVTHYPLASAKATCRSSGASTGNRFFSLRHCLAEGQQYAVHHRDGSVSSEAGPRVFWGVGVKEVVPMTRHVAEASQYLHITHVSGDTEIIRGPASVYHDPLLHLCVEVKTATTVNSGEVLVTYSQVGKNEPVKRTLVRGPAVYVPGDPSAWVHMFSWHGAAAGTSGSLDQSKRPGALQFTKLRVTPQSMYHQVRNVRTKDDARLQVDLMLFYQLRDIERMLDESHDPIGELINSAEGDVVEFAGARTFEQFKDAIEGLSSLKTYEQLRCRAENIGYLVTKVTLRSYQPADPRLAEMHSTAIKERTELVLNVEKLRQREEAEDFTLQKSAERDAQKNRAEVEHQQHSFKVAALARDEANRVATCQAEIAATMRQQKRAEELKEDEHKRAHDAKQQEHERVQDELRHAVRMRIAAEQAKDELVRVTALHKAEAAHYAALATSAGIDVTAWLVARERALPRSDRIDKLAIIHHASDSRAATPGRPLTALTQPASPVSSTTASDHVSHTHLHLDGV